MAESTGEALEALARSDGGLGLAQGAVAVVEHNPTWPSIYQQVEQHLAAALNGLDVEIAHIGSTSVPDLAAKPVMDIAVGAAPPIENRDYVGCLEAAGFAFEADLGIFGGLFFIVRNPRGEALAHLHVVDRTDFQWRWYLAFRDALRSDASIRTEYETLKKSAAAANADDRDAYTQAKFDWVLATVQNLDANGG